MDGVLIDYDNVLLQLQGKIHLCRSHSDFYDNKIRNLFQREIAAIRKFFQIRGDAVIMRKIDIDTKATTECYLLLINPTPEVIEKCKAELEVRGMRFAHKVNYVYRPSGDFCHQDLVQYTRTEISDAGFYVCLRQTLDKQERKPVLSFLETRRMLVSMLADGNWETDIQEAIELDPRYRASVPSFLHGEFPSGSPEFKQDGMFFEFWRASLLLSFTYFRCRCLWLGSSGV